MTVGIDSRYTYVRSCRLFMYNVSVKPGGCNVFSFPLRYCLVIMCCHCRSSNDVKQRYTGNAKLGVKILLNSVELSA